MIIILCLIAVAVLVWLDNSIEKGQRRQPSKANEHVKPGDIEKYSGKTFTVVNVVDGDTIDIDIGDGEYENTRIRLWGIDTPETKADAGVMYYGPQASEFTEKLSLAKEVTVYLVEHRTRGKYGRLLGYVQLPDSRFLNEVLISEGYAYADLRFEHSFYYRYKQLESAARNQKKGLWAEVKRNQWPKWRQEKLRKSK